MSLGIRALLLALFLVLVACQAPAGSRFTEEDADAIRDRITTYVSSALASVRHLAPGLAGRRADADVRGE